MSEGYGRGKSKESYEDDVGMEGGAAKADTYHDLDVFGREEGHQVCCFYSHDSVLTAQASKSSKSYLNFYDVLKAYKMQTLIASRSSTKL
jgi:hypothetical protein